MIKIRAEDIGAACDGYVAVCDRCFGAPSHKIAADISQLEHKKSHLLLAIKLSLAFLQAANPSEQGKHPLYGWIKYLPRFIPDEDKVKTLNAIWEKRSSGLSLSSSDADLVDQFLQKAEKDATVFVADCDEYLKSFEKISKNDPLLCYKACALLDVEYDETNPSFWRMLVGGLFPSLSK